MLSKMSILQYYKRVSRPTGSTLPNPDGPLSGSIPSRAIAAANLEVRHTIEASKTQKKRGAYHTYTPQQRTTIGKHAVENGVLSAKRKYSKKLNIEINESTVRSFKKAYLEEMSRKHKVNEEDVCD